MTPPTLECLGFQLKTDFASVHVPPFRLKAGAIAQLFGLSGAGLDDVFYCLAGLLHLFRASRPAPDGRLTRVVNPVPDEIKDRLLFLGRPLYALEAVERASKIGCIYEDPGLAIIGETVLEDFNYSFAAINQQPPDPQVLRRYGLYKKLDRHVDVLSGGERQRLNCATSIEIDPRLLFADFTNANLDSEFMVDMKTWLRQLAERGCTVVVAGPRPHELCPLSFVLHNGSFLPQSPNVACFPSCADERRALAQRLIPRNVGKEILLRVNTVRRDDKTVPISLELHKGEILVVHGPNGVGKTTLGKILAGQIREGLYQGTFDAPDCKPVLSHQYPERTFVRHTVAKEAAGCECLLSTIGITQSQMAEHALRLPRAQQKLLSVAITLHLSAGYAILDEPTCGLDYPSKLLFVDLLNRYSELAVLIFSHDEALVGTEFRDGLRYQPMGV